MTIDYIKPFSRYRCDAVCRTTCDFTWPPVPEIRFFFVSIGGFYLYSYYLNRIYFQDRFAMYLYMFYFYRVYRYLENVLLLITYYCYYQISNIMRLKIFLWLYVSVYNARRFYEGQPATVFRFYYIPNVN